MERRKLIHFGKSAFCITLPHLWIKKNKLQKGDIISVKETSRNSLEIIPAAHATEDSSHLIIDITGKSTDEIIPFLLASYLNGYSVITLQGPNAGKVSYVRKHVHEFIAAEVMEVTPTRVVIHVFWDVTSINIHSIINRIGHIIKSICMETIELLAPDSISEEQAKMNANDILEKGFEAQRQVLLAKRAITYALNNTATAQRFNLSSLELHYLSYITYFLGMIAEHLIEVLRIVYESKIPQTSPKTKKDLSALLERTLDYLGKTLNAYHKQNKQVRFVLSEYRDFEHAIERFREKNPQPNAQRISEYVKMILIEIKEAQYMMINSENCPK